MNRWRGYWRRYGNTLGDEINGRYRAYAIECRTAYVSEGNEPIDIAAHPLRGDGLLRVKSALDASLACSFSDRFSTAIERSEGVSAPASIRDFMVRLNRPLDVFGQQLLEIFGGRLDEQLRLYFGSYYRIEWLDCYRTYPTGERRASWRWHMDNVPIECIKIMLHLTGADVETGATRFLSREQTNRYHERGYFGIHDDERVDDLTVFAARHSLPFDQICLDMNAGDVLIFDNNLLHSGVPPQRGLRDVMTFLLLPNPISWREHLNRDDIDVLQDDPGGFPYDLSPFNPAVPHE